MKTLKIGSGGYDRIQPLADGTVTLANYELAVSTMPVTKIPGEAWGNESLDMAEVAIGQLLEKIATGDDRYLGLPVFPSIAFRHDSIFVPTDGRVQSLEDLSGARLGTTQYFGTTTIWMRALLEEQYHLDLSQCAWTIGPLAKPAAQIRRHHAEGANVAYLDEGDCIEAKIDRGELDAVLSYVPPRQVAEGRMRRLIVDLPQAEREWMAAFGTPPLLHVMILRRSLADENPEVVPALVEAFVKARDIALKRLFETACLTVSIPTLPRVMAEAQSILGGSIWPCGVAETRKGIDAFADFAHRQGLTSRRIGIKESFLLAGDQQ